MRLVCPNCDAEYEVDDAAIPMAGRDVQCSNCGHGWFQAHPEVEAEQAAEPSGAAPMTSSDPDMIVSDSVAEPAVPAGQKPTRAAAEPVRAIASDGGEDGRMSSADNGPEMSPEAAVAAALKAAAEQPVGSADSSPAPSRALDESVLAVLREEAAREVAARRAEAAPVLETQTEMGLAPEATGLAAAASRRLARLKGTPEPEPVAVPKTRREMLPAIEEINSTLRATNDRRSEGDDAVVDTMADEKPEKAGFGRGFTTLVLLAVILVALYLLAPLIGAKVPALAGAAKDYVAAVDAARVWLDTEIKALVATLRGIQGTSGG